MRALKRVSKLRRNSTFVEFYNARAPHETIVRQFQSMEQTVRATGGALMDTRCGSVACDVQWELNQPASSGWPIARFLNGQAVSGVTGITSATSIVWVKLYLQATLGGIQKYT